MISLEEIRQVVTQEFKTAHDLAYPNILVNYPNFLVVDIEHQVQPFVNINIDFGETSRAHSYILLQRRWGYFRCIFLY